MADKVSIGDTFGRLRVIAKAAPNKQGETFWLCACECGGEKVVRQARLRNGKTSSCGCLQREVRYLNGYKHGGVGTPEYKIWEAMKGRCLTPGDSNFGRYGARGIGVCDRWRDSFENFLADMGPKPSPAHSIERINNDGNYEPGNCRWATMKEQQRNRSNNRLISFNGETRPLAEWCEMYGAPAKVVWNRLARGWDFEKALLTPNRP